MPLPFVKTQEIIKCKCGCGIEFEKYDKQWRSRKYIYGHGRRKRNTRLPNEENIIIKCECGCGEKFKKYDSQGRPRVYKTGSHSIIKNPKDIILNNIETNENGCWIWQGYKTEKGYGQIRFRNKTYLAHRFSYEVFKTSTSKKYVCHKCNNPNCINPEHLYLGSQADNIRDMGRFVSNETNEYLDKIKGIGGVQWV